MLVNRVFCQRIIIVTVIAINFFKLPLIIKSLDIIILKNVSQILENRVLNILNAFLLYGYIGAVVITDGVFALPDAMAVDSLMAQLRASTVCCSFIKVGSGFHAHCR